MNGLRGLDETQEMDGLRGLDETQEMDGLYEIISTPAEGVFEVRLNPDHAVFRGHFPDNPVLPGICSLMIIRECASLLANRPLRYSSVKESKFLAAITPQSDISVNLKLSDDDDGYSISAAICCVDTVMLKLKAGLTKYE